ncbi:MAG: DEAD/DEAH box helicase [Magnetococcus sp. MYC-9]
MPPEELACEMARENYERLTAIEQAVLQFLSLLMEPIHRTNLAKQLREVGIRGDDGRSLSVAALGPIVDRLAMLSLITTQRQPANPFCCADTIAAHATRAAVAAGRLQNMVGVIRREFPLHYGYTQRTTSYERCLRELRIAVFFRDEALIAKASQLCYEQYPTEMAMHRPWTRICATPFDADWFRGLPPSVQFSALGELIADRLHRFEDMSEIVFLLGELRNHPDTQYAPLFRRQLIAILLFQGRVSEAQAMLDADETVVGAAALQGWAHFLRGEYEEAIHVFEAALHATKRMADKRQIVLGNTSGTFFLLALLRGGKPGDHARLAELLAMAHKKPSLPVSSTMRCLEALLLAQQNKLAPALELIDEKVIQGFNLDTRQVIQHQSQSTDRDVCSTKLFKAMTRFWIDLEYAQQKNQGLTALFEQARRHGYLWAAMELAGLMAAMDPKAATYAEYAATIQRESGLRSMLTIVPREEPWQRALKALVSMGSTDTGKSEVREGGNSRLVWMIKLAGGVVHEIQPREQVRSANGGWSKGRPVALKRLFQNIDTLEFLTDQDRRICTAIVRDRDYYGGSYYEFSWQKAILAMVGHPLVFWEDTPHVNVEVVKSEPELLVAQKSGHLSIRFAESVEEEGLMAIQETPTRCKLVEITAAHKQIAEILGNKGLRVPARAKEEVMRAMQAVAPLVTIHSDIGGGMANMEEIPADATPHLHLLPHGEGLRVSLLVRPFSGDGPYFQLGKGGKTIIAEVAGKRVQTHRNMRDEAKRASAVLSACPVLASEEGESEWILDDPESCLELLENLQTVADQVVVAWPEGEKMQLGRPITMDALRVQIRRDQTWFAVTGEVQVDESLVMGMAQLLDLARDKESRFIPLGEGKFLALTEAFRKRLAELDAFSEKSAKGQRFHPLAGTVIRELFSGAGAVESDRYWKTHLKQMDQAQEMDPAPPPTLRAELREYQVTGFRWLARLAAWGVGGCLADDMGLGKTLQALALLLHRAQEGPSLVVAPTSVGLNWLGEIGRFAPTLNGIVFGGGQRQQMLDLLKPFDVVICSYGLLQQEAEMLTAMRWNVIVLDEAQAIKNRLTKRSQAAMALQGAFRVATTGTPVENHLGELWNLFQFLNPGLLGSLERFNERFATPIERHGDKGAQKRLRKLVQPFLLRRTKSQVLEELPSRTEIVLHVELSAEEMAFYETLRRKAIEQIEGLEGPPEQKRFQILAELMRLRRACCNSRLVLPDSPIESTKLAIFWEVVEELLENRHKALVFSQFVDHLSLIRALLDEKKIAYQYLDGSTPAKERQRRVDAFQSGEGDLFLISLRAGGMGINLTAADYVIHMDPWWNPAVEDQASDRAHRIGQLRPVTIYRLVTQETIEEKIVDLHRHKRDLADGLLEGGEMSGKLSVEQLLNMIRGRE